jgi:hypothetical protein
LTAGLSGVLPVASIRKTEQQPSRKLMKASCLPFGGQTGIWSMEAGRALAGDGAAARDTLAELASSTEAGYVSPVELARVHVALGDHARALDFLERAVELGTSAVVLVNVEPAFDALRGSPRFRRIVRPHPGAFRWPGRRRQRACVSGGAAAGGFGAVSASAALEGVEAGGHVATEHAELLEPGAGLAAVPGDLLEAGIHVAAQPGDVTAEVADLLEAGVHVAAELRDVAAELRDLLEAGAHVAAELHVLRLNELEVAVDPAERGARLVVHDGEDNRARGGLP